VIRFQKRYVANVITIFRIFLILPLLYFIFSLKYNIFAIIILTLAALSDWLDGFIAHSMSEVTDFGRMIDPLADRLFILSVIIALYIRDALPPFWALMIFVCRDSLMIVGYRMLKTRRKRVDITYLGKTATAILMVSFILLLLKFELGIWLFYLGLILYLISGFDYLQKGLRMLSQGGYEVENGSL